MMELLGQKTCFVHQQRISSTASPGILSCSSNRSGIIRSGEFPARWASSSNLLLLPPRVSERSVSRTSGGNCTTDCRVWRWICQFQEQRLARPPVGASATISAGGRSFTSARRRSTSRRPEGSGGFNVDLELEILAFMLQSGKSDAFPSKEELISAGRLDLVEAIFAEGGWLASGWEKKTNGCVTGGGILEVSHRPLSRQRAIRNKSRAVRSPRRPRGRPKLADRRTLAVTASPGENPDPDEPQKDAVTGQTDDRNIDSPRDGNGTDAKGATKPERLEKDRAASSMFKQVRREPGSKFPSISAEYKLWEFESLSAFIEYRKLDAKNGSMQRQQMGLCSNSSVRKEPSDPEAAKTRQELWERRCDAASKRRRKTVKCDKGIVVTKTLDTASTVEQQSRVDDPKSVKAELDSGLTIQQATRVDEAVKPQAEFETTTTVEEVTKLDEAVTSETEATIAQDTRVEETLYPESELDPATTKPTELDSRFDGVIHPQAEFYTEPTDRSLGSNDRKSPVDPQAAITAPEVDLAFAAEQDTGAKEASSLYQHLEEASTCQQEVGEPVAEAEGKLRKKKKKRRKVKMEKIDDVCKTPEKLGEALDWINQMMEEREKWMLEAKSSSEDGPSELPKSVQNRIRSLEDRLSAARTALQSGRGALRQTGDGPEQLTSPSEVHTGRLAEIRDASDELEYTENKILKLSSELTTTRREVAALEGARGIELMDIHNIAGKIEKKIETARTGLHSLRAARIVWPHPAQEVFLIGSFDDWNDKIKMELSGAGVFVVSLPLSAGRYEIKFIVDGTWRVDTDRPIVYVGGYENNVLVIPEKFTFDWRK